MTEKKKWAAWDAYMVEVKKYYENVERARIERRKQDFQQQLDEDFARAQHRMTLIRKQPTDEEMAEIYGLEQQIMNGNINIAKPSSDNHEDVIKWNAWFAHKGKSRGDAQHEYIAQHNWLITNYGWRPMGHVLHPKTRMPIPGAECALCEPLWDGWTPKKGWWDSDDEDE